MKKLRLHPLLAVAAVGALVFGPFAHGQDASSATTPSVSSTPPPGGPGAGGPEGPGGGHRHPGERLEKLAEALGLTDAQKEQLKPILQNSMEQMKALHDDTSLTPEAKHEKMKGIREEMEQQIKAILTPEQLQKWKELKEERREKHGGFGGPGGAGSPNPPPITTGTAQ